MELRIEAFEASDWPRVAAIYADGIASGLATFETECPSWEEWDAAHLACCRLVARQGDEVAGWAALSPVSRRQCYAGVAEVSVYVGAGARGQGVGRALLEALIHDSEAHGIWTLQGATFAENVASLRLQAACGFRVIGWRERIAKLNGVWRDTILTERRSGSVGTTPSKLIYEGKHLHFYIHETGWEFVHRAKASQGVVIVAATERRKIVLVEQLRIPIGKPVIELPAGLVGDAGSNEKDDPVSAAKRELEEETGYACEEVELICSGSLVPGLTDELNSLCWAKGLKGHGVTDNQADDQVYEHEIRRGVKSEGEKIRVYDVPLTMVQEWLQEQIQKDKVVDMKVYLGVFFLRNVLKEG